MFQVITILLCCTLSLTAVAQQSEQDFLSLHWADNIAAQGGVAQPVNALLPESCGACHPQQYEDWQTTLHSKAMGPGIAGQLVEMVKYDPSTARVCWKCHAPLQEQQNLLNADGEWITNPGFNVLLQQHGMTCVACHVRNGQHYGPPRRGEEDNLGVIDDEGLPHNGFTAHSAFRSAAFCKGCHQFNQGDFALNGKLIENTYNEWQQSRYAEEGVVCQDCHMSDRRHLWRGIHDPEMTRSGVDISVVLPEQDVESGHSLSVQITLANNGTGHHFPTYLTPKVFVRAFLLDGEGEKITSTQQQAIIGRDASLDLQYEYYDTRIPAGETVPITYQQILPDNVHSLQVEVEVEPDHFYEKFYRAVLADNGGGAGRDLLLQALSAAEQSNFFIYQQRFSLR